MNEQSMAQAQYPAINRLSAGPSVTTDLLILAYHNKPQTKHARAGAQRETERERETERDRQKESK